jgi:hypothetical protein
VPQHLSKLGITGMYRTSIGTVYVYENELPFYFVDADIINEETIKIIDGFVEKGFTSVKHIGIPMYNKYLFIAPEKSLFLEISRVGNTYKLTGSLHKSKEERGFQYIEKYTNGELSEQSIILHPITGKIEIIVTWEFVENWSEFLNKIRMMKRYDAKNILVNTVDLPGVVNTARYPPNKNLLTFHDEMKEFAKKISFGVNGMTVDTGKVVAHYIPIGDVTVSLYPVTVETTLESLIMSLMLEDEYQIAASLAKII